MPASAITVFYEISPAVVDAASGVQLSRQMPGTHEVVLETDASRWIANRPGNSMSSRWTPSQATRSPRT
jgi:hypothetical protein